MKQEIVDSWLKRAEEALQLTGWEASPQLCHFATSMLAFFYGPSSPQMHAHQDYMSSLQKKGTGSHTSDQYEHCTGVVKGTVAEIKAGLIRNTRTEVEGEVLSDLIGMAKEILSDSSDTATQVAAVLTAASFEDTMRRLAAEKTSLSGRPKLEAVITSLKDAGILKGGEVGVAMSYLKFRNDSLHADWKQVQRSQVDSCVAFIESMLLKHFSG